MFKGNSGKLMVYASTGVPSRKRLDSVRIATKETAKQLNLDFEIVRFDRAASPIYVYYEEGEGNEPIPLYCDEGKMSDLEEISSVLRNMMFVLSFHPKHSALRHMRDELLKLS
jgi:sporulation-control protein spo0M